eukprot:3890751-Prymnesium_polylepis.2
MQLSNDRTRHHSATWQGERAHDAATRRRGAANVNRIRGIKKWDFSLINSRLRVRESLTTSPWISPLAPSGSPERGKGEVLRSCRSAAECFGRRSSR